MSFKKWTRASAKQVECPPDIESLGRAGWTILHSMAAQYPEAPSVLEQAEMRTFLRLFSRFYPCWHCGEDFGQYLNNHQPNVRDKEGLSLWMCDAHNDVSKRLGKKTFDCARWRKRWLDGCMDMIEKGTQNEQWK
jgi:FAD-linked sulfhydryl oxidase